MVTAIANRKIETSVLTQNEAVHVVPSKRDAHAESIGKNNSLVGDTVVVFVDDRPEFWNVGVINAITPHQCPRSGALLDPIEA